jgi:pimeloyl-ACP methyl ester carboxylesterase
VSEANGEGYLDGRLRSQDDLSLYYRDYGDAGGGHVPVLCLAGLTRNSDDFHKLALRLSAKRRVLALDLRGRARSDRDPVPANYEPRTYLNDIAHLLAATNTHRVVVIGTSLGGVLAMAMTAVRPTALAGVVLNDVGPEIAVEGLDRIRTYVGREGSPADYDSAARQLKGMMGRAYPEFTDDDWLAEARARYRPDGQGRLRANYDPKIMQPMATKGSGPIDLWPYYRALARVPALAIRGDLSDILDPATFERMAEVKPDLVRLTVPNRGHVPLLTEPVCGPAIESFLENIDDARA